MLAFESSDNQALTGKADKSSTYAPDVLGHGAESVVVSLAKVWDHEVLRQRGLVAKIDLKAIGQTLIDNANHHLPANHLSNERKQDILDKIETLKHRAGLLRQYFPKFSQPERYYIESVPVDPPSLSAFAGKDIPPSILEDGVTEVPTLVRLQHRVPEQILKAPTTFDLSTGYRELDSRITADNYKAWNHNLLADDGQLASDYLGSIDNPDSQRSFARLIEQVKTDPNFKTVLRNFAETAVTYTLETGEILDLFGNLNILIHKQAKTDNWTITFIDALHPDAQAWSKYLDILSALETTDVLSVKEMTAMMTLANYARNLNALLAVTDSKVRLRLPPTLAGLDRKFLAYTRSAYGLHNITSQSDPTYTAGVLGGLGTLAIDDQAAPEQTAA